MVCSVAVLICSYPVIWDDRYSLYCNILNAANSTRIKSQKSRFAALADTINSWEDEVTPPSAKSVHFFKFIKPLECLSWKCTLKFWLCFSIEQNLATSLLLY